MDLEDIMLNKSDREKQILYDFTYMRNLKNKWTKVKKQKQSYRYREQTGGVRGERGKGRKEIVVGD